MNPTTVLLIDVIIDNIIEMNDHFARVFFGEGAAPLLVLAGTMLVVFSLGVFGLLTAGALGSLFTSK